MGAGWTKEIVTWNEKLRSALDKVITAKDDKARVATEKPALALLKQYQGW